MMEKFTGKALDIVTYLMGENVDKQALYDLTLHHEEKKQRSLDANAYFHALVAKLAQAQSPPISKIKCKNMLIADYGQEEYIDGQIVVIKSNLPPEKMENVEYLHTSCVKIAEENGKEVYFYKVYRGTHTYNTAEFSKLLEGTIEECRQVGIETATAEELARMKELWENSRERKRRHNEE